MSHLFSLRAHAAAQIGLKGHYMSRFCRNLLLGASAEPFQPVRTHLIASPLVLAQILDPNTIVILLMLYVLYLFIIFSRPPMHPLATSPSRDPCFSHKGQVVDFRRADPLQHVRRLRPPHHILQNLASCGTVDLFSFHFYTLVE